MTLVNFSSDAIYQIPLVFKGSYGSSGTRGRKWEYSLRVEQKPPTFNAFYVQLFQCMALNIDTVGIRKPTIEKNRKHSKTGHFEIQFSNGKNK